MHLAFIFLAIPVSFLLGAFFYFDRLVKIEYRQERESWIQDGKPMGFFWQAPESSWLQGGLARNRLSLLWLFSTPKWVAKDRSSRESMKRMRVCVVFWNLLGVIFFIWFLRKLH